MIHNDSLSALLKELESITPGPISGSDRQRILSLLEKSWHQLRGADETSMEPWKIGRAEGLRWNPPVLSFTIERHGATVRGSTRAELQDWIVDLKEGTARCMQGRYRQLTPTSPRLDVKPIAASVCEAVQQGKGSQSDLVRDGIIVWKGDDEVWINHGRLILGSGYEQTVASRRRRFRKELTDRMKSLGWNFVGVQRSMIFEKATRGATDE